MIVYAKLPRAGLGNKLLVWSRAYVFAKKNNLKLYTFNWLTIHIGPILRGEKSLRLYLQYTSDNQFLNKIKYFFSFYNPLITEPELNFCINQQESRSFLFYKVKYWQHAFDEIKMYRNEIKYEIENRLAHQKILTNVQKFHAPVIGVHIRMGDFSVLPHNENLKTNFNTRTPLSYFINLINGIREVSSKLLPVTVFSDAKSKELMEVLSLSDVNFIETGYDFSDLLLLSKSKIIITSASSTFGLWAGFLSNAILFQHPEHYLREIRPGEVNINYWEGFVNPLNTEDWPDELVSQLKKIS